MRSGLDIAWAAGFIDGEGCFSLFPAKGKGCHPTTCQPGLSVAQARREPLDHLAELFGGSVVTNGSKAWQWQIQSGERLREIIPLLLPHLILKKDEAEVVLAYAMTIRRRGKTPINDAERSHRQSLIDQFAVLRDWRSESWEGHVSSSPF